VYGVACAGTLGWATLQLRVPLASPEYAGAYAAGPHAMPRASTEPAAWVFAATPPPRFRWTLAGVGLLRGIQVTSGVGVCAAVALLAR
jgi:hypothetical protein